MFGVKFDQTKPGERQEPVATEACAGRSRTRLAQSVEDVG
jgi:hypothetical protein